MDHVEYVDARHITREFCAAVAEVVDKAMAENSAAPFHYMISGTNVADVRLKADCKQLAVLKDFASSLASTLTPGMDVISVRLLFSPPNSPAQRFHLDYAQHFSEVQTIFISVSPSTSSNCTEWLNFGAATGEVAQRARELARKSGVLELPQLSEVRPTVERLVLSAWQTCILRTSHVFHRRGPNRSDFTRITFNVDVAKISESPQFIDLDMRRSLLQHRICGQEVVDDLDEQDICVHGFEE
mmetsp:Transcript_10962/g.20642  ORF Transcript_10962/g.20642 Transcript_10962/m.20642 type:complete len:242 (+) Transcript_10962:44-769(+)